MKNKPLVVYPDADGDEEELHSPHFARLRQAVDLVIYCGQPGSHNEYVQRIGDARGVILGWDLPSEVMQQIQQVEVVSFTGVGASKFIDLSQARDQGITVCNCPGYSDITVAEHSLALLLSLSRHLCRLDREIRTGNWNTSLNGLELHGKTIGLVGFGGIGKHLSRLCRAFGMQVLVWTPSMNPQYESEYGVQLCELSQLYARSDIVSLHLASNSETEGIVDANAFNNMQPGTLFINTARAELVEEDALINAVKTGHLGGAALDVFHNEPLVAGHPLCDMEKVILTPHIGYNTPEAVSRLYQTAIQNIISFFDGKPINVIT